MEHAELVEFAAHYADRVEKLEERESQRKGPRLGSSGNVVLVPGSATAGVIYFVKVSNPLCADCDAPSIVMAVSNHGQQGEHRVPVCAVDGVYRAADGAVIFRFEDEDILTRTRHPETPLEVRASFRRA